jgi:hypothetical protein
MRDYRKTDAAPIAQVALELATRLPELVYRNLEKIGPAWKQMRADRAAFVEFFGCDEVVLHPAEAEDEERINSFYQHRHGAALARRPARRRPPNIPGVDVPAFQLPPELADADTVGIVYDEIDGLSFMTSTRCYRAE